MYRSAILSRVVAAGFLILALGCGKDAKDKAAELTGPQPLTDIAFVSKSPDRRALNGTPIQFSRVLVQAVVGNFVFWAGALGDPIPIVRGDRLLGQQVEHVKVGETVDILGSVRTYDRVKVGDPYVAMWDSSVSVAERASMEAAAIFIAADRVTVNH